jgi:uncharacterized protein (DUF2267 family)
MRLGRDDIIAGLTELATRMDALSIAATIHTLAGPLSASNTTTVANRRPMSIRG